MARLPSSAGGGRVRSASGIVVEPRGFRFAEEASRKRQFADGRPSAFRITTHELVEWLSDPEFISYV